MGYELYFIEYITEDEENYLRIYIDNIEGISLHDCVKVTREISPIVDEVDPTDENYCMEVSSPGIFRELHNDSHLERFLGSKVSIKLKEKIIKLKEKIVNKKKNNRIINRI